MLVSTAVVEVGIDVPNATVMLIEGADRFGLAQLHQFRGRVGRGRHPSWCFLLADEPSEEAQRRLSVVQETLDGFELAQADLELRGPGELYGLRQSGASVRVAALLDAQLIDRTRREAAALLAEDPRPRGRGARRPPLARGRRRRERGRRRRGALEGREARAAGKRAMRDRR